MDCFGTASCTVRRGAAAAAVLAGAALPAVANPMAEAFVSVCVNARDNIDTATDRWQTLAGLPEAEFVTEIRPEGVFLVYSPRASLPGATEQRFTLSMWAERPDAPLVYCMISNSTARDPMAPQNSLIRQLGLERIASAEARPLTEPRAGETDWRAASLPGAEIRTHVVLPMSETDSRNPFLGSAPSPLGSIYFQVRYAYNPAR